MQEKTKFSIKILKYETIDGVTQFKISVTDILSHETWFILKRYSELLNIHEQLVKSSIGINIK
jgi:hypothetical protein